jgi:membrane protease YdiL (CAAX protease family)
MALLMTWVYLSTDRSILSAMFMHFTSNFTGQLLASVSERVEVLETVFIFVIGLSVCLLMSRKGQNAYQSSHKNTTIGKVTS